MSRPTEIHFKFLFFYHRNVYTSYLIPTTLIELWFCSKRKIRLVQELEIHLRFQLTILSFF